MGRVSRFLLPLAIALAAPTLALAQSVEAVRPGDRTLGSATAPVTLTVYLSATCSHCADWHTRDFPAFRAKYVDTGQVRVAFRDLPTPPQPLAEVGAVMARCVPEDRYDDALEALFQGQKAMRDAGGAREAVIVWLRAAGQAGGLTTDQMNACVSDDQAFAEVEARAAQSVADGVQGTPTFLLNGAQIPDGAMAARDVTAFDPLIQPLLAGR
jgi:protein-disulfide isomerase